MLGIGIVTYNRASRLSETIDAVRQFTARPFILAVADDGSSDGTRAMLEKERVVYITGDNRGVCWNKNRTLFFLKDVCGCDPVIMLEDDTRPQDIGWEANWVQAAESWGHVNYALPRLRKYFSKGTGTVVDPYVSAIWSGQCTAFSRTALSYVGYLDTRFRGFGYGHGEHTRRFLKMGFGGGAMAAASGKTNYVCKLLESDLNVVDDHTYKNDADLERNRKVLDELENEAVYRSPWSDASELKAFKAEIAAASQRARALGVRAVHT